MFSTKRSLTISLITVICGAYLLQMVYPTLEPQLYLFKGAAGMGGVAGGEWYRLFTVALTHGGLWHLAFNMIALHSLGTPIETFLGRSKFLIIFFVSLIGGSITSAMFLGYNGYSIGASGAVFGLFGAWAVISRKIGAEVKSTLVIIGLNFVLGFTIGGVDWRAHLGGLIAGAVVTKVLLSSSRS